MACDQCPGGSKRSVHTLRLQKVIESDVAGREVMPAVWVGDLWSRMLQQAPLNHCARQAERLGLGIQTRCQARFGVVVFFCLFPSLSL